MRRRRRSGARDLRDRRALPRWCPALASLLLLAGFQGAVSSPCVSGRIDPYEDFAESFALSVHRRLLGGTYRVDVFLGPERVGQFRSCLDTGRCPGKTAYLEQLFTRLLAEPG